MPSLFARQPIWQKPRPATWTQPIRGLQNQSFSKDPAPVQRTCGEISSPPCLCLYSIVRHFTKLCFSFAIFSFVSPPPSSSRFFSNGLHCLSLTTFLYRERENVAESSKQCIFMVVGKPHQDKAVKMAGRKPPRYACRFFFIFFPYVLYINLGVSQFS